MELVCVGGLVGRGVEELGQRPALEGCFGDQACDGLECERGSGCVLGESEQQIGDQGGEYLDAHRILAGAEEVPDFEVLHLKNSSICQRCL